MNKLPVYFIFIVALAVISYQIYTTEKVRRDLKKELSQINSEYQALIEDGDKLNDKIQYFSESRNLEKEARGKLNYKAPAEKLIIVAPKRD